MVQALARVGNVVALVALIAPVTAAAQPIDPRDPAIGAHVRGATPLARQLIERGRQRSPTFAALVAALDRSDVIVYVEITDQLAFGLEGRLALATTAGPLRYLRAQVISGLGADETIAVAAHELQHALEVAADPRVRDGDGFALLYARIGMHGVRADRYDTLEAQRMGRRVRNELG